MRTETRVRLIALLTLVLSLGASGVLSVALAASVGRHGLAYTDRAEDGDPPQVALGIAMGAFRGVFVNYLWLRAMDAKDNGRYFEAIELARAITDLQPRFPRVWVFHAWNMAYNISVTTQTPDERWRWVNSGIRLLRDEGLRANPDDMLLHKELGWIFLHKIGGYTDDANQYYKRRLAAEWQGVLGEPPEHDWTDRTRAARSRQFAAWFRPIVDAPDSLAVLRQQSPEVADLVDALRTRAGVAPDRELLERHALYQALVKYARVDSDAPEFFGPRGMIFVELAADPAHADAWPLLLAHVRRRVLLDDYNMEPLRIYRLMEDFGPVDLRLPAAHGLYWALRGVREGQMEVNERNSDSFDFVNTYRIVVQSLQDLWRYGELYFNYLDVAAGKPGYYQAVPQPDFVESYGEIVDEAVAQGGIFEAKFRVYRPFAAGYENLMEDAIAYYYRRGDRDDALRWYERLRTWEGQNTHAPADRLERLSKPLDEFVAASLHERLDAPTVVVQEVYAALYSAFFDGLLLGDDRAFFNMVDYARAEHNYYNQAQFREVVAGGNVARTEYLDRDFDFVIGQVFAEQLLQLPPDDAEIVYGRAGRMYPRLQLFGYAALRARYQQVLEQRGDARSVDDVFPRPEGYDEFRVYLDRKLEERSQRAIEGVREN